MNSNNKKAHTVDTTAINGIGWYFYLILVLVLGIINFIFKHANFSNKVFVVS